MSNLESPRTAADRANWPPEPSADPEVERLRLLIERQPTCLLRIGMDGLILAASDAALGQLAARELGQALGHRFAEWLPPAQRDRWQDFAGRVRASGAASVECELLDLRENRRAVRLQGVSQPGHPDGRSSMIVTIRDISGESRLEKALQEHEIARRALAETSARLEPLLADTVRIASQARRLVRVAAGQISTARNGPNAKAKAETSGCPAAERAGGSGRTP